MKRPVTILCLSDLHLVPGKTGEEVLARLKKEIKEYMARDIRWQPDFIVMAGDLVDAKSRNYPLVSRYIDSIVGDPDFRLHPFRVVAVPGNHDKMFRYLDRRGLGRKVLLAREKKKNKAFSEQVQATRPFDFGFKKQYAYNFSSFGAFYSKYVKDREYGRDSADMDYVYPSGLLGEELEDVALTSGIKVFHRERLCFLCINTEWTFLPEKDEDENDRANVRLCAPLVYHSLKAIHSKYPDYTLVTVMHRNPVELSWEERNRAQVNKPDILYYLYSYSDVILTGHNHIERILPPHRMSNRAPLFQLGSASMESRENSIPQYYGALMHIDPIRETVELLDMRYDHFLGSWKIKPGGRFDLPDKYTVRTDAPEGIDPVRVVKAKSIEKGDIEKAISSIYPTLDGSGYTLLCLDVKEADGLSRIGDACLQGGKTVVVVYSCLEQDAEMLRARAAEISREFRTEILGQRLIVNKVLVSVPDLAEIES
ncbi:MAG: metallophosphoesterase [Bacteroidales bacterium]|nr:metallophosphoesterase [Bacteroidales bacterium]